MTVVISMFRGVNLASHHRITMEALREVFESLGLPDCQTWLQSGNAVFKTRERDLVRLAKRIEAAFGKAFGFQSDVILRTAAEMQDVVARNPVAARSGIEPSRLLVSFLAAKPAPDAVEKVLKIDTAPEELWIEGRELYIYFPNGMARPKLPVASIERILKVPSTGRNWNTVTKLVAMAEALEAAG